MMGFDENSIKWFGEQITILMSSKYITRNSKGDDDRDLKGRAA
jgi:hypothetical protein